MKSLLSSNKKGQVQNIAPAILALIFAAIVLVFGLIMAQELRDTQVGATSKTVINETVTLGNVTGNVSIAKFSTSTGWGSWNITLAINTTGSQTLVEGTQYKIFTNNGTILNLTSDYVEIPAIWSVTYVYSDGGEAFRGGNSTVLGLGTFADFWEIIVLAIVITVVIGLLLVVFGGRARR